MPSIEIDLVMNIPEFNHKVIDRFDQQKGGWNFCLSKLSKNIIKKILVFYYLVTKLFVFFQQATILVVPLL